MRHVKTDEHVAVDAARRLADAVIAREGEEIEKASPRGATDRLRDGIRRIGQNADANCLAAEAAHKV